MLKHKTILIVLFVFILNTFLFSEGTKEIMPTGYSYGRIEVYPYFSNFALYNSAEENRLNIRIKEVGEKIYFGFGRIFDAYQSQQLDLEYRIKNPSGVIVAGPAFVPVSGNGFINSYDEAIKGPNTIATGGYSPVTFVPATTGDYYIEFNYTGSERREMEFFDITVANSSNQAVKGRVWSKAWQMTTTSSISPDDYQYPFDGKMYIYADDGIVTSIDFNGMKPYVFTLSANETGCFNTGNFLSDRKSVYGLNTYPQYKIFFNEPDSTCFPTGFFGDITAPTTLTGCPPNDWDINISVNKEGFVKIVLDLNGIPGYQSGSKDVLMYKNVNVGVNSISWNGLNGLGSIVPSGTNIKIIVSYFNGLTNLPLYDVERLEQGYKVRIKKPYVVDSIPALFWDDSDMPGYYDPPDEGCTDVNGCHAFSVDFFGDENTINTWWYVGNDIKDSVDLIFIYATVNAGNDTTLCLFDSTLTLHGVITNASGGVWSGGSGSYSPNNNTLNAEYHFSNSEISAGTAQLTLTTINTNGCPALSDKIKFTLKKAPVADAGTDKTICNNSSVELTGLVSNAGNGKWYGGTGTFSPSNSGLTVTYMPGVGDVNNGFVDITFETTANGSCPAVTDQITLFFFPSVEYSVNYSDDHCKSGIGDASVNVTNGNGNYSYIWNNNETSQNINGLSSGVYYFTVTDANNCTVSDEVVIGDISGPDPDFYANPEIMEHDNPYTQLSDNSFGYSLITSWTWDFGDSSAMEIMKNLDHTFPGSGHYNVKLIVEDIFGCKDSIIKELIVKDIFTVYIPNAFTPDGDGINDNFYPKGVSIDAEGYEFYIYNRWGNLVFKTNDVNGFWDGTCQNEKCPAGVYAYKIVLRELFSEIDKIYAGHVTLIR